MWDKSFNISYISRLQVDTFPLWVDASWATEVQFFPNEENAENTD